MKFRCVFFKKSHPINENDWTFGKETRKNG